MKLSEIWPAAHEVGPPWIWITTLPNDSAILNLTSSSLEDGCIRTLRGDRIVDWESFHDEFSAAFQFPAFYGRNINAAVDCLRDLNWCESEHRTFINIVLKSERLLRVRDKYDISILERFYRIASQIGSEMSQEYQWSFEETRPPTAFKFVFQVSDLNARERLRSAADGFPGGVGLIN